MTPTLFESRTTYSNSDAMARLGNPSGTHCTNATTLQGFPANSLVNRGWRFSKVDGNWDVTFYWETPPMIAHDIPQTFPSFDFSDWDIGEIVPALAQPPGA